MCRCRLNNNKHPVNFRPDNSAIGTARHCWHGLRTKMLSSRGAINVAGTLRLLKRGHATEVSAVTSLYNFHVAKGGKIVNFGGYLLPVQYSDQGIASSHLHTRTCASLFDVSHMLQTEITGADCIPYIESVTTADIEGLRDNSSVLTVFTNENGGILDDLIVTKIGINHLYIVSNAARKKHDQQHLLKALDKHKRRFPKSNTHVHFFDTTDRSLLALQGPKAAEILQELTDVNLSKLYFMTSTTCTVAGVGSCRITRCGYTGEDGFEISLPAIMSQEIANEILQQPQVKLAGLGPRDSLRLEAGLCLYGNDITEETTPVEAGLTWLVAKRRRELGNFPGAKVILSQITNGIDRKRVGIVAESGPPARHGHVILDKHGNETLGVVTSGSPAPSLGKNIAMGYVPIRYSEIGTEVLLKIRDRTYEGVIAKMPFVKTNYYTKPKHV